jgi:metal-sulfur cluster biosynthetic enzyme
MSDDDILAALKSVIDPELGINVVDLGLVCRAARVADAIEVALAMTSPACPLGEMMVEEARLALQESFPDASSIHVELVRDLAWSPERMSEEGRRQLGLS